MSTEADFQKAAEDAKNLKSTPNDLELLELYGLYKQATVGDCNTVKPGMLDFRGKAKWDNWESRKGLSKEDAQKQYISVVKRLIGTYGMK